MGETDAARVTGRKQARIAAASRTTATERNAPKSSACTPNRRLCMVRPTKLSADQPETQSDGVKKYAIPNDEGDDPIAR